MLVIYLYFNQHKNYAEIAEKEKCRSVIYMLSYRKKNKQDDKNIKRPVTARRDKSKAYKLFSKGKRSLEVAIALNLRARIDQNI